MTDLSRWYTVDRLAEFVVNADQPDISVEALTRIGMTPTEALGAACWDAREWLDRPGLAFY
jgi:imidazolonepropionase-like amidohydrolase